MNALLIAILSTLICVVGANLFTLEVENFVPKSKRTPRSDASGNFSAHLLHKDQVKVTFCVLKTTEVSIRGLYFSNDGRADTVRVTLDAIHTKTFRTSFYESGGKGWNLFRSSGLLVGKVRLPAGKHVLVIDVVEADAHGLELDKLDFIIGDDELDYEDFICKQYCFDDVNYNDVKLLDSVPSGRFVQKSKSTTCAEQDNIRVDVYHNSAKYFEIRSHLPKYGSFANLRDPFYEDCVLASPLWNFTNVTVVPRQRYVRTPSATLSFGGSPSMVVLTIIFNFMRFTRTRELDERYIGSVLRLRLRNLPRENASVRIEYRVRGRWASLEEKTFTPFENDQGWEIDDRAWDVNGNNQLKLIIKPGKQQQVIIDTLRLDRRNTSDETFELYADSNVVFQGVRLGFWHHWQDQPDSMTVEVGDTVKTKVDSIRMYSRVPWSGGYAQVFVLFQDGRVRIQSLTPHGLDYVPFGSSVFIGQPKYINKDSPYAPIKTVAIDALKSSLRIEYVNGNTATFVIETAYKETVLTVSEIAFKQNRKQFPIMTFKSMWISDGQADVDHVTVNGGKPRHINMKEWRELYGISATFFRKCISSHNTQAPDITIQFLDS